MQEPDTSTNSKVPVYHGVDRCSPKVAPSSAGTAYAQNENHGISTAEDGNLSNTLCTATPHTTQGSCGLGETMGTNTVAGSRTL